MHIKCESSVGATYVSCQENLPFYAMLLASFASMFGSLVVEAESVDYLAPSLIFMALVIGIFVLVLIVCTSLLARYHLARGDARILTREEAPGLYEVVSREATRLNLKRSPSLYVAPSNTRVAARVLGGFSSKLVVSGGLCVLAAREQETAAMILRHELAHILNGDTRLFLYISLVIGGILSFPLVAFNPQLLGQWIGTAVFQSFLLFPLLRRREYIADAVSVNLSESAQNYLRLFASANAEPKHWYHPSWDDRRRAIHCGSPVLNTSFWILFLYAGLLIAGLSRVIGEILKAANSEYGSYSHSSREAMSFGIPVAIFLAVIFPLIGTAYEFSKGFRTKRPLALRENLPWSADNAETNQLTKLLGVGRDESSWNRRVVFLLSVLWTFVPTWQIYQRHLHGSDATWIALGPAFGWGLFSGLVWGGSILVSLRSARTLATSALVAAICYSTIEFIAGAVWYRRVPTLSGVPTDIAFNFVSIIALILFGRFLKPFWLALFFWAFFDSALIPFCRFALNGLSSLDLTYLRFLGISGFAEAFAFALTMYLGLWIVSKLSVNPSDNATLAQGH